MNQNLETIALVMVIITMSIVLFKIVPQFLGNIFRHKRYKERLQQNIEDHLESSNHLMRDLRILLTKIDPKKDE